LVLEKRRQTDEFGSTNLIALNQTLRRQGLEHRLHIDGIAGEDFEFDVVGPIEQAALPIRQTPEPFETNAVGKGEGDQIGVGKEPRFDRARAHRRLQSLGSDRQAD
jgi:hypothetical protein